MSFALWVDDIREAPLTYDARVRTVKAAIILLKTGIVTHISLDHDLGGEETGYEIARWIEDWAYWGRLSPLTWEVYSNNPPGRAKMIQALKQADKFWGESVFAS